MSDYEKKRSDKMDRQGARTPADIERKYNIGKSFAEVNGIATDARNSANAAAEAVKNLDHEGIFNLLTKNGEIQGIYEKDGQIYINAEYVDFEELNGKDIKMTGTLTNTMETYLEPGVEEFEMIRQHLLGNVTIPSDIVHLYDFDGNGKITAADMQMAWSAYNGDSSIADYPNFSAVKSVVTLTIDLSNPDKAIRISGKNMWGRDVDGYIGVNTTSATNPRTEQRLLALEESIKGLSPPEDYIVERGRDFNEDGTGYWIWEKWNSGLAKAYAFDNRTITIPQSNECGSIYRSGVLYFDLPIDMTSVDVVIPSCYGIEETVWAGQAKAISLVQVVCDVFSGIPNTVNTEIHLEVIGKWK